MAPSVRTRPTAPSQVLVQERPVAVQNVVGEYSRTNPLEQWTAPHHSHRASNLSCR